VLGGKWTRVRLICSAKATKTCRETLTIYRLYGYIRPKKIGARKVALRPGKNVIFSVHTVKFPHYPVYATLT